MEASGLRKTSVDQLTRAAGIPKGTFYLFYASKEELFLEILEQIEAELRAELLDHRLPPGKAAQQSVSTLLKRLLAARDRSPLLRGLGPADFEYLGRKIPAERVQAHVERDESFSREFVKKLRRDGITPQVPPGVVANLLKSLFFVGLHQEDLGAGAYAEAMDILVDLVARYIVEGA